MDKRTKEMIIVRVWGGLGNQMFQYAVGYAMSKKNKIDWCMDTSFFDCEYRSAHATKREFGLHKLRCTNMKRIRDVREFSRGIYWLQKPIVSRVIRFFTRFSVTLNHIYYIKETRLMYMPELFDINLRKCLYLDGYWHSEKYFKEYRNDLLEQFVFSNDHIIEEYKNMKKEGMQLVAVHIRRGDYVSDNNPNIRGEKYYRDAMCIIEKKISNPRYCFFSDDVEYVEKVFYDLPNKYIVNEKRMLNDIEELQLMIICDHQIISNSSYSWWGGWLNTNVDKIVIAPGEWQRKKDMMPDEWERC